MRIISILANKFPFHLSFSRCSNNAFYQDIFTTKLTMLICDLFNLELDRLSRPQPWTVVRTKCSLRTPLVPNCVEMSQVNMVTVTRNLSKVVFARMDYFCGETSVCPRTSAAVRFRPEMETTSKPYR